MLAWLAAAVGLGRLRGESLSARPDPPQLRPKLPPETQRPRRRRGLLKAFRRPRVFPRGEPVSIRELQRMGYYVADRFSRTIAWGPGDFGEALEEKRIRNSGRRLHPYVLVTEAGQVIRTLGMARAVRQLALARAA
jgi:hypothetical protein